MATQAFIPVGTRESNERTIVKKGDIVKLATGEEMTFLEMKRTKFIAKNKDGQSFNVPVYRDRLSTIPYIIEITGFDKSVEAKSVDFKKLNPGQLFAVEGSKETFMFLETKVKRGGKTVVVGFDIANEKTWTIPVDATFKKINVSQIKKEKLNV